MTTLTFDIPHVGTFETTGEPGTNFGLRVSAEEVIRLFSEHTWNLPFEVMAAGYGDDEDWVALQYDDLDENPFAIDASYEELETQWGPFELSVGPMREPTPEDIKAADARGYYMKGGEFDYDYANIKFTPLDALGNLASFVQVFEGSNEPRRQAELDEALSTLAAFIKQVNEHGSTDLEWGEPGDCWDRIGNDPDLREELGLPNPYTEVVDNSRTAAEQENALAIEKGLGRHYGDPHCIWCLEAM